MKKILIFSILATTLFSCYSPSPQPVIVQPPPQQVTTAVQNDPVGNYQIMTDAYGNRVVYYTDPYSNLSYYLEWSVFNSLIYGNRPYYAIHNYYLGHTSYINSYYNRYHSFYNRTYYNSRSDNGAMFRRSSPGTSSSNSSYNNSRPSSPGSRPSSTYNTSTPSSNRGSSPGNRPNTYSNTNNSSTRTTSLPSSRPSSSPSFTPARSSSSSSSSPRSSSPGGRRRF